MKKLLLLLFLIPNLVMAKSYLCIAENAAGIQQNYGKGTYTSKTFRPTGKFVVKKINNEWKVQGFGESDDMADLAKCEKSMHAKGTVVSLDCSTYWGSFEINFEKQRFVAINTGDWAYLRDKNLMGDGSIKYGSCSSI